MRFPLFILLAVGFLGFSAVRGAVVIPFDIFNVIQYMEIVGHHHVVDCVSNEDGELVFYAPLQGLVEGSIFFYNMQIVELFK